MEHALMVSQVLLWVAVLGLALGLLALLRQVGLLHERIAPAGALVGREGPAPGEEAPVLEVEDWSGQRLRVGGVSERDTLLVFVSPTCPVCKTLLPLIEPLCRREGEVRPILASDGPREEHESFVADWRLERGHYLLSTALGLAYQVSRLPYAVLIGADGVVRARGLVNTREHLESLFEARARGVGSLQEFAARRSAGRASGGQR